MRVLITTDWYEPVINGVVTSVMNLSRQLRERGHEVKILTLSRTFHSYIEGEVVYAGSIGLGCIYPQARLKIPKAAGDYMEMLLEWKPDIVHSQCEFSTFFLAKRIASELHVPIVHTYHTVYEDYTHYFSPQKVWGRNIVQLMTKKLANAVETLIAPSDKIRKILEGYQVSCPVEVIPSGIHLEKYQLCKKEDWRKKIRMQLGISQDALVLVYVGRMAKEKNIEELLEYQQDAGKSGVILVLVGDGPYLPELKKKVEELKLAKNVIFTGMIIPEEVGRYYQAGDLFVSASTSETQGMTYAEALAGGIPLLCRRDGCLEQVVTDGENGWQYDEKEDYLMRIQEAGCKTRLLFQQKNFLPEILPKEWKKSMNSKYENTDMKMQPKKQRNLTGFFNLLSIAGLAGCALLAIWAYKNGIINSVDSLQTFIRKFSYTGMLVFILIQVVQVIIPILPGGVSCLGGVIFFGPWLGFLYNYIGICIGSIAVFGISKTIGRPVLYKMFSERMIEKYDGWTQKDGKFLKLFALAIFFPVAPDDFLCYLAGTTKMTWKQFTAVIVLGKPFSIALYSLGLTTAFKMLFSL